MNPGGSRRRQRRRAAQVIILGLFALFAVLLAAMGNPAAFNRLSGIVFDLYQQIRPREEAGAPVVIIDIDDASLIELGQWPWPRSELARMVDRLGELGAAAIFRTMTSCWRRRLHAIG
jgi:adenylate cyclase